MEKLFAILTVVFVVVFLFFFRENRSLTMENEVLKQVNQIFINSLRKSPETLYIIVDGKKIGYKRVSN